MKTCEGSRLVGTKEAECIETGFTGHGPFEVLASITSVKREQGGVRTALLYAPEIARRAKPMQFVQVKVVPLTDPFLRRPFGFSRISPDEGIIGITWATVGKGTSLMAGWHEGDTVSVLGPLGNGLQVDRISGIACTPPENAPEQHTGRENPSRSMEQRSKGRSVWLIAGGTGLAPLYPLAESMKPQVSDITVLYGAKTSASLMDTSPFGAMGCRVTVSTEDGSKGARGRVTEALGRLLASAGETLRHNRPLAVACGPAPMLRAVKSMLADTPVELYISLEERMACGTGLCRGCAVKAASPRRGYLHVCTDGPVFPAGEVLLGGEG